MVFTKIYEPSPPNENEILRYAGCKSAGDLPAGLFEECIAAALPELTYKVCYSVFDIAAKDGVCDFGAFTVSSKDLSNNLADCRRAVIFAATVGVGIDRLISRYSALSPVKAVIFQAIGAERIENLCDRFCADFAAERNCRLKPRFSPGYGDFDLLYQRNIFSVLGCEKHIGLTLTGSMLMSPSKSVTAVAGLCENAAPDAQNKCEICKNENCIYRGSL